MLMVVPMSSGQRSRRYLALEFCFTQQELNRLTFARMQWLRGTLNDGLPRPGMQQRLTKTLRALEQ